MQGPNKFHVGDVWHVLREVPFGTTVSATFAPPTSLNSPTPSPESLVTEDVANLNRDDTQSALDARKELDNTMKLVVEAMKEMKELKEDLVAHRLSGTCEIGGLLGCM